jgi:hypothetical protein
MYAVNARYGSLNDFQHVAYTAYFYDSAGNPIGNGGRFVSWLYPGFRASDSGSATFNDYASQTYQFSGHATISIWIFEEWFDYPSTNGWGATHNIRTGWAWEPVGTCNV